MTQAELNCNLDKYAKLTLQQFFRKVYNRISRILCPKPVAKLAPDSRRVVLPRIETYLANGCNLKCHLCSHLSPKRKGVTATADLKLWMDTWKEKIVPGTVAFLGGEPLLKQDIAEMTYYAKKCWENTQIEIVTNGILLKNLNDSDFAAIKEVNGYVVISQHTTKAELVAKIIEGIKRLEEKKIRFEVRPSIREWVKYHQLGPSENPLPYQSNPIAAWQNCIPKECVALWNNNLYKCSVLANMQQARQEEIIGDEWKAMLSYKPLTPESTASEIIAHLSEKSVPECCICPEKYEKHVINDK